MPNPNPILDPLEAEVARATTVEQSAATLINGFQARLDKAVADATANGATADQLAPLTDLSTALKDSSDSLSAAVTANTPAAPTA